MPVRRIERSVTLCLGALTGLVIALAVDPSPDGLSGLLGLSLLVLAGALLGQRVPLRLAGPALVGLVFGQASGVVLGGVADALWFAGDPLTYGGGAFGVLVALLHSQAEQRRERRFTPTVEQVFFVDDPEPEDDLDERLWLSSRSLQAD